eukprot:TRINITY_DN43842_c0_g1_i1.p1 TRINITY_DN43842_c0_g1~~TRINITY_DN43842_c0_g1_i1.p1  ORF type:complete len:856 (-),score=143.94 TRINITY_DN43842_c0_g1_i1:28-2562(-)
MACQNILRFGLATVLQGVGSGLTGIFVAKLIETVQMIGFGNDEGGFLHVAEAAPGWRRMASVCVGGIFGAVSWYCLRGATPHFVPVSDSMDFGTKMPPVVTIINAIIQDTCVALGGSFGREAAPREIAAMWGGVVGDALHVTSEQRRVLVACGTGAGLAAVYSVPISGALYTIEHILDWDMSPEAVIPAIATSAIATVVTFWTVTTNGLYDVPNFSYAWPNCMLCIWAVIIGPIVGVAAAFFCKLVAAARQFRPSGRLPAHFDEAPVGHSVKLALPGRTIGRTTLSCHHVDLKVVSKTSKAVTVALEGETETLSLSKVEWDFAAPVGRRDWTILIGMPAAFFVLALLSVDFPALLGNGRALTIVSMQLWRPLQVLFVLFFLKAFVTAAAIGSGADGGTLTPSVALGATLGVVVGSICIRALCCVGFASDVDEASAMIGIADGSDDTLGIMAVVAASGFLAAAMKSPATGLWLLVEFSAQGVRREDIVKLFYLDPSGLVASKLAVGALVPCSICVFLAMYSFRFASGIRFQHVVPVPPVQEPLLEGRTSQDGDESVCHSNDDLDLDPHHVQEHQVTSSFLHLRRVSSTQSMLSRRRHSSASIDRRAPSMISGEFDGRSHIADDLDLGHEFDAQTWDSSCSVKSGGFFCFQGGLLLNTVATVGFAAAQPRLGSCTTIVSLCGVGVATASGALGWYFWWRKHDDGIVGGANRAPLGEPMLPGDQGGAGTSKGHDVSMSFRRQCSDAAFCAFCSLGGAAVPAVPWLLQIYNENPEFVVILSSAACAIVASTFVAAQDAQVPFGTIGAPPNTGKRPRAVARQAMVTSVVALLPLGIGLACGRVSLLPLT